MFIIVLLTLFVLGDAAWGWYVASKLREEGVKGTPLSKWGLVGTGLFFVLTLGCLGLVLVGRMRGEPHALPVPLLMAVFLWHMMILPLILVGGVVGSLIAGVVKLFRRKPAHPTATPPAAEPSSEGIDLSRRRLLAMTAAVAPPAVLGLTTGWAFPRLDDFRVRSIDLPIPGLPPDLNGLSIAHVSDTHLGDFTTVRTYNRILDAVNLLRADLIVHTGDIINVDSDDIPNAMEGLKKLDARRGIFACEGNHDLIQDPGRFWRAMRELPNVRFLRNDFAGLTINGVPIQIFGARWATRSQLANRSPDSKADSESEMGIESACSDLQSAVEKDAFPLLLAHHPHAFDYAPWAKVVLSGHTHGGQVMLTPNLGPGPMMYRYWSGIYRKPGSSLFVTNGAGNWFPLRTNAPAEVVKITLRTA